MTSNMFGIALSNPLIVLIAVVAVAAAFYVAKHFFGFTGFDTSGIFQTVAKIYQGATAPRPKPRTGFFFA